MKMKLWHHTISIGSGFAQPTLSLFGSEKVFHKLLIAQSLNTMTSQPTKGPTLPHLFQVGKGSAWGKLTPLKLNCLIEHDSTAVMVIIQGSEDISVLSSSV
jgi:hypothetical protein